MATLLTAFASALEEKLNNEFKVTTIHELNEPQVVVNVTNLSTMVSEDVAVITDSVWIKLEDPDELVLEIITAIRATKNLTEVTE